MGCVGSKAIAVEQAPAQRAPEAEFDVVAPAEEVAAAEQAAPAVPTTTAANEKKDDHHDEAPVDEASAADPASAGAGDESNDDSRGGKGDNNEAAAKRGFPLRPSEVDCASLSKIFGAEVASFEMDTSTVEAGVLADAFRVDVVYADSAAAAEQNKPLSVFLKCTKHIEAVADMSSASNTYSKEIYFYETLRDQVKDHVRVPEVYGLFRDKNDPQCKEFLLVLEALKVPEEWVTYEQFGIGADPMSPSDLESYMTCLASLHACTWAIPVNEEQPGLQQYAMHWYEAA